MKYGLFDSQLKTIEETLSSRSEIEEAVLFGSRAIDTFKEASDVDIALKGKKVTSKLALKLQSHFEEETDLPYFFDFISYSHIDSKNLIKHIDKEGIIIYRKGWQTVKLGDIVVLNYGKSLIQRKRIMGNIPVYSSAGIIDWHTKALVKNRGIVIGRKGTIGSVYKSNTPFFPIDTTFYISENNINCNLDFLFYTLSNLGLNKLNSDSAVPGLNRNTAYIQKLLLPLLPEQKAIAEVLSSLDDKIELLHKQNKTLEDMAQTLFHKWFIENAKPTWKEGKLEEFLGIIESGSRPKGGINHDLKEGVPSIGAESINGIGNFDFSKTKYVTYEFFKQMKKGIIKDYDILIYKDGAYIGKKAMFGNEFPFKEMAINEHIFILRSNNNTNQIFIYFLLKPQELSKLNANSAQPGLNQQSIKSLKITIPPKNMMYDFGNIVKPWINKIFFNSKKIKELENLRDTILPKLINGQVRVKCPH